MHGRIYRSSASLALFLALLCMAKSSSVRAAELVVLSSKDCHVTRRFRREVTPRYSETQAAKTFPLRFVEIDKGPGRVILARPATTSPTFVFVNNGREIARFVGYPGRDHFLRLMDEAADAFQGQESAH